MAWTEEKKNNVADSQLVTDKQTITFYSFFLIFIFFSYSLLWQTGLMWYERRVITVEANKSEGLLTKNNKDKNIKYKIYEKIKWKGSMTLCYKYSIWKKYHTHR